MYVENESSDHLKPIDVLVIDDDAAMRDSLQVLLEADGLSVHVDEGTRAFANSKLLPACIVLDLQLNDGPSFKLMELIADLGGSSKIVVITGSRERYLLDRAYASGADLILEKPFRPRELLKFVRTTLVRP